MSRPASPSCSQPNSWSVIAGLAFALVVAAGATGCCHCGASQVAEATALDPAASPGVLPPPDAIPGQFTVRQKISARSRHGNGGFEAVLQKQPGRLTLLGLTPYGSRAFLLEQSAQDGVKLTSYIPRELPFSPGFVLMDIHRVLGDWLGPRPAGDLERSGVVNDERVTERWKQGHLTSRTFAPATSPATAPPVTTVAYEGGGAAGLPAKVTIQNTRLGYTLEILTVPM